MHGAGDAHHCHPPKQRALLAANNDPGSACCQPRSVAASVAGTTARGPALMSGDMENRVLPLLQAMLDVVRGGSQQLDTADKPMMADRLAFIARSLDALCLVADQHPGWQLRPAMGTLLIRSLRQVIMSVSRLEDLEPHLLLLLATIKGIPSLPVFPVEEMAQLKLEAAMLWTRNSFPATTALEEGAPPRPLDLSKLLERYFPWLELRVEVTQWRIPKPQYEYVVSMHCFHVPPSLDVNLERERVFLWTIRDDLIHTSACLSFPRKCSLLLNGHLLPSRHTREHEAGSLPPMNVIECLRLRQNVLQLCGVLQGPMTVFVAIGNIRTALPIPRPLPHEEAVTSPVPAGGIGGTATAEGDGAGTCGAGDDDEDLLEGPVKVHITCPISFQRIQTPVKGVNCNHPQCVDLESYLQSNQRSPCWRCACCNNPLPLHELRIDALMAKILRAPQTAELTGVKAVYVYPSKRWQVNPPGRHLKYARLQGERTGRVAAPGENLETPLELSDGEAINAPGAGLLMENGTAKALENNTTEVVEAAASSRRQAGAPVLPPCPGSSVAPTSHGSRTVHPGQAGDPERGPGAGQSGAGEGRSRQSVAEATAPDLKPAINGVASTTGPAMVGVDSTMGPATRIASLAEGGGAAGRALPVDGLPSQLELLPLDYVVGHGEAVIRRPPALPLAAAIGQRQLLMATTSAAGREASAVQGAASTPPSQPQNVQATGVQDARSRGGQPYQPAVEPTAGVAWQSSSSHWPSSPSWQNAASAVRAPMAVAPFAPTAIAPPISVSAHMAAVNQRAAARIQMIATHQRAATPASVAAPPMFVRPPMAATHPRAVAPGPTLAPATTFAAHGITIAPQTLSYAGGVSHVTGAGAAGQGAPGLYTVAGAVGHSTGGTGGFISSGWALHPTAGSPPTLQPQGVQVHGVMSGGRSPQTIPTPTVQIRPTPTAQVRPTPTAQVRPTPTAQIRPTPSEQPRGTPDAHTQPQTAPVAPPVRLLFGGQAQLPQGVQRAPGGQLRPGVQLQSGPQLPVTAAAPGAWSPPAAGLLGVSAGLRSLHEAALQQGGATLPRHVPLSANVAYALAASNADRPVIRPWMAPQNLLVRGSCTNRTALGAPLSPSPFGADAVPGEPQPPDLLRATVPMGGVLQQVPFAQPGAWIQSAVQGGIMAPGMVSQAGGMVPQGGGTVSLASVRGAPPSSMTNVSTERRAEGRARATHREYPWLADGQREHEALEMERRRRMLLPPTRKHPARATAAAAAPPHPALATDAAPSIARAVTAVAALQGSSAPVAAAQMRGAISRPLAAGRAGISGHNGGSAGGGDEETERARAASRRVNGLLQASLVGPTTGPDEQT